MDNINIKKKVKTVSNNLQRIGTHLVEAAAAGVDVVLDQIDEDSISKSKTKTVLIAGNSSTGKTTLLYTAKYGPTFNKKLLVPTVGHNLEIFSINDKLNIEVIDVGGGKRMGPLFYKHAVNADALFYIVRGDDPHFVSSLWELYLLLYYGCLNGDIKHVEILLSTDTSTKPEVSNLMTRLLQPDALPPTREKWETIFNLYDAVSNIDQNTINLWNNDRLWTELKKRTFSHGMPINNIQTPQSPQSPQSPQTPSNLTSFYRGSWNLTKIPPCNALLQEQAIEPIHRIYSIFRKN